MDELSQQFEMSTSTRFYGFVGCVILGVVCGALSFMYIPAIVVKPSKFAVMYTMGNILAIASGMFLFGPWNQVKRMFAPDRAIASTIYIASMIATLYAALILKNGLLVIILLLVQVAALVYFSLSYIPFARRVLGFCCGNPLALLG